MPASAVRILVGLDVPAAALTEIVAGLSADRQGGARGARSRAGMIAIITGSLQRLAIGISGVAVAERSNPFSRPGCGAPPAVAAGTLLAIEATATDRPGHTGSRTLTLTVA